MITSHHNETLKDIRRLLRRRDGTRFVAEGEDLLAAAAEAGWAPAVQLRNVKVLATYIQGEQVYGKK